MNHLAGYIATFFVGVLAGILFRHHLLKKDTVQNYISKYKPKGGPNNISLDVQKEVKKKKPGLIQKLKAKKAARKAAKQ